MVGNLTSRDKFTVVKYSTNVTNLGSNLVETRDKVDNAKYTPHDDSLFTANEYHIMKAVDFIQEIKAEGGREIVFVIRLKFR